MKTKYTLPLLLVLLIVGCKHETSYFTAAEIKLNDSLGEMTHLSWDTIYFIPIKPQDNNTFKWKHEDSTITIYCANGDVHIFLKKNLYWSFEYPIKFSDSPQKR